MDVLTVLGWIAGGLMILLGLILIVRPSKPKEEKHQTPEVNQTAQIDLFSHLPVDGVNQKREPVFSLDAKEKLTVAELQKKNTSEKKRTQHSEGLFEDTKVVLSQPDEHQVALQGEPEDLDSLEKGVLQSIAQSVSSNKAVDEERTQVKTKSVVRGLFDPEPLEDAPKNNYTTPFEAVDITQEMSAIMTPASTGAVNIDLAVDAKERNQRDVSLETQDATWSGDSQLLDAHLDDQLRRDDHSTLAQAEKIISLYLLPKHGNIGGDVLLGLMREFGLRFGEMSLFHRFEQVDGSGPLMFSILKYTTQGASGFDLESLVNDEVEGLAFFLALPNAYAIEGYDSMMHIAELLSRKLDAEIFDDEMCRMTSQAYEYIRQQVINYN